MTSQERRAPRPVRGALMLVFALAFLTTACSQQVHSLSGPTSGSTGPDGVVVSATPTPRASVPTPSPSPTSSATSSTSPTPASTVTVTAPSDTASRSGQSLPTSHPPVNVYQPHGFTQVAFASPSGRIWCGIIDDGQHPEALCDIPEGPVRGSVATGVDACPGVNLDVTAVQVTGGKVRWLCAGDSVVDPRAIDGNDQVGWDDTARFPTTTSTVEGNDLVVVLPYNHAIQVGHLRCTSYTAYMTCADTTTHNAFYLSSEAISVTGQPPVLPSS